jgi:endonuclease/exonuclease/phosphatase family metal-dependent hydrolase
MKPCLQYVVCLLVAAAICHGAGSAFDPANGDFAKEAPEQIRVLSYNVEGAFMLNSSLDGAFERIIKAVRPDIIAFQEISYIWPVRWSLREDRKSGAGKEATILLNIKQRLETYFPGTTWTVHRGAFYSGIYNALATRFEFVQGTTITDTIPYSGARGVTAALIDLPDVSFGVTDLYIMAVHFKSGQTLDDHRQRQRHADASINWMRDARTSGGHIDLPRNTPMLLVGDTNLGYHDQGDAAPYHASRTLINGDIFDEATFGPDSPPDWDGTDSTDAAPYDHVNGNPRTCSSREASPTSRLDRFIYTDSGLHVAHGFILNTHTMSTAALANAGLQAGDTTDASNHLPVVVDFAFGPNRPGQILINEFSYDDTGPDDHSFVEFKNVGGQEINLDAPLDYHLLRSQNNLPSTRPTTENQSADFDLHGVIPPGGLFVLFDSSGESAAIGATIERALPEMQRQDLGAFSLNNGPAAAIALVTVERTGATSITDTLVEAYLYDASSSGGEYFFLTDSDNNLLIDLRGGQVSTLDLMSDTLSFSRAFGDRTPNSFASWKNPDSATPGQENGPALLSPRPGDVVINEVDYDSPGTDTQSFVEIRNVRSTPVDLRHLQLVGLSGSSTATYFTYQLGPHVLAPGEYWVLGTTTESSDVWAAVDETMAVVSILQNGPGGVYLCLASAPNVIIDSVSCEGSGTHPPGSPDSGNAGADTAADRMSLARFPDGRDTNRNTSDFHLQNATPGAPNARAGVEHWTLY